MKVTSRVSMSVLLPAFNAERYVAQSVQSVLAQTREDFELLVVDDGSTDRTRAILSEFRDPRLRVIEHAGNRGVVASLNHALAQAKGEYIVRMDADDYCTPTRFARQRAFLDAHPHSVLVATDMAVLSGGRIQFSRDRADPDPTVLRWMLHLSNPVGHSSMMFRAAAVQRLGSYLQERLAYAEDFDFTHRMLTLGDVSVLPEYLTIYRHHDRSLTRLHRGAMIARTAEILAGAYADLLGEPAVEGARLVSDHLVAARLLDDVADWRRLGLFLRRLSAGFERRHAPGPGQQAGMAAYTAMAWNRMVARNLRAGRLRGGWYGWAHPPVPRPRVPLHRVAWPVAAGVLRPVVRPAVRLVQQTAIRSVTERRVEPQLNEVLYRPVPAAQDRPPTLYVVARAGNVFTEGQRQAQLLLERHGIRPVYLVAAGVAGTPGAGALRDLLRRHGCILGDAGPGSGGDAVGRAFGVATLCCRDGTCASAVRDQVPVVLELERGSVRGLRRRVRALVRRGRRLFLLCYGGGAMEVDAARRKLDAVCSDFLGPCGGMAGNPVDLLPPVARPLVWPSEAGGMTAAISADGT